MVIPMNDRQTTTEQRLKALDEGNHRLRSILSTKEASDYLGISTQRLYYAVKSGRLKAVKYSNRRLGFRVYHLDRFRNGEPMSFWKRLFRSNG